MSPSQRRRATRLGFSLLEGLFSMFLVALVLSALSSTLVDTGKIRANRVDMDRASEELHIMGLIRSDLVAASELLSPSEGASGDTISLRRVNPELAYADRIGPLGDATNPYEPDEHIDVSFRVEDGALMRSVLFEGVTTQERVTPCVRLLATRQASMFTVSLTFAYSRVEKTRTLRVELR